MKPTECACCSRIFTSPEDYLKGTTKFRVCSQSHLWFECSCGSGIMLRKGDYEWYSPTLKMSESAATIFQNIREISNIPLLPSTIIQVQAMIADEKSSDQMIQQSLKSAPNLALSLMRAASHLNPGESIRDLEQAINLLGRKTISELILTETLQEFDFKTKSFRKDEYWREAIVIGQIAEYLAEHYAPHLRKEEAYIAGSLLNIGKVVGAICFPQMTDEVARATRNKRKPMTWSQAEDYLRALSHVILGEVASAIWGFPDYVTHALAGHHQMPENVPDFSEDDVTFMDEVEESPEHEDGPTLQQVVALANQFAHLLAHQPSRFDKRLFEAYCQRLELTEADRQNIINSLGQEIHSQAC